MDRALFERNLRALSPEHGELRARLSPRRGRYRFLKSRSGDTVPALIAGEESRPLHSLMDPRREAERLITSILGEGDGGCLVFFGLGGAYAIRAALERQDVHRVIALDLEGTAELLGALDYSGIFSDRRFSLLADPAPGELEAAVLRLWQPALQGGIRVIPLRPLVEFDGGGAARNGAAQGRFAQGAFAQASLEVQAAVDRLSADYSVQAWFGTRWFSNIIRNVFAVEERPPLPRVDRAAVCAAGPSLEDQMPLLAERREGCWLLSVDTALPALLAAGLEPDAVISMDCQHISYQHFMRRAPSLFLDLSSPPLLASRSCAPRFFAGGHPLARYLSRRWRSLPELDTSGANVTGAACSLAEYAGAREIELYGADFSYPLGKTYARGTYLYPWFERRQNRLAPQEAQASSFLYRDGALAKCGGPGAWYYETALLRNYRESLEREAPRMGARIRAVPGRGAPLSLPERGSPQTARPPQAPRQTEGSPPDAESLLRAYREAIRSLPLPQGNMTDYTAGLEEEARLILGTLLPALAAFKRREPGLDGRAALERARDHALAGIAAVLEGRSGEGS